MPQQPSQDPQKLELLRRILMGEMMNPISPIASHVPQPGIRPRIGPVPDPKSIFKRAMQGENIQNFNPRREITPSPEDEFFARVPNALRLAQAVSNFTPTPMDAPEMMGGMADLPPLPGLFSRLQGALKSIPSKSVHPNKVASIVSGMANPEEAELTGLNAFIQEASQGGKMNIPTQDIVNYAQSNPLQLREILRGGEPVRAPEGPLFLRKIDDDYAQMHFPKVEGDQIENLRYADILKPRKSVDEFELQLDTGVTGVGSEISPREGVGMVKLFRPTMDEAIQKLHEIRGGKGITYPNFRQPSKYDEYSLPGGQHPWNRIISWEGPWNQPTDYRNIGDEISRRQARVDLLKNANALPSHLADELKYLQEEAATAERTKFLPVNPQFSSHAFGAPNTQVWSRGNIRETPKGPFSFLEEIQSDWHQKGNERGYGDSKFSQLKAQRAATLQQLDEQRRLLDRRLADVGYLGFDYPGEAREAISAYPDWHTRWDVADKPELVDIGNRFRELKQQLSRFNEEMPNVQDIIPNSPFKQSWVDLALKRELYDAAEKDLAGLAWTPGSVQNRRWSLTNVADELDWQPFDEDRQGLLGIWKGGERQSGLALDAKDLPNYVGKGIAEQLFRAPREMLNVGQMEVGKRGMNQFYDRDLPGKLKKILNPLGQPFQIENVGFAPNPSGMPRFFDPNTTPDGIPIQGVQMSPALKRAILKLKFPML